jgi:3-oxoadipate enol-lactonase
MPGGNTGSCPPALPAGRYVDLPGRGQTFVRELPGPSGAPVVVLLHGWTATADLNWHACYAPLAEHFRVVALDHRGHGRGLRPAGRFRLDDCADDVAALAEALRLERVIPVGYSMGGSIAQLLWQRHRHLVGAMVLCATSCTFSGSLRERVLYGVAAGTSLLASAVPVDPLARAAVRVVGAWHTRRGDRWWGLDEIARHDWAHVIEAGRELGRFESRPWLAAIDVPAAVIVTEDDDVVPVDRQHDLVDRLEDPAVYHVPGGHSVCTHDPQLFASRLVEACATVTARAVPVAA